MATINSHRPPSGFGTFFFGIIFLAFFAGLLVIWVKFSATEKDSIADERGAARFKKREELEKDWAVKLHTPAWVDKEKSVVQVPIDDAIRVVALELKDKKVAKTEVKVLPGMLQPSADPKSTEPPPPALPSAPQGADLIHFDTPAVPSAPTPATPAPAASIPAPAAKPEAPAPANPLAKSAPARPPLINWTESK